MRTLARLLTVTAGIIVCVGVTLPAQWRVQTKGVPLTPAGTPNLEAPAPKLADGKTPDLSGLWDSEKRPCDEAKARLGCIDAQQGIPLGWGNIAVLAGGPGTVDPPDPTPFQPWAQTLVAQRWADFGKDDPHSRCLPQSSPRAWAGFDLQKIIHTQDSLTVLSEFMAQHRQIFLDGRPLPTDPEPTFKGYSVGKWEEDTLVVETIGYKENWLDSQGRPLTEQARTIERIRRVSYGTLEVEMTIDDPKAYTKPWKTRTQKLGLVLNTDLLEYICNENEKSLQHMVGAGAAK
jgi:hypothetical protein